MLWELLVGVALLHCDCQLTSLVWATMIQWFDCKHCLKVPYSGTMCSMGQFALQDGAQVNRSTGF